jgi:hypothetical protein
MLYLSILASILTWPLQISISAVLWVFGWPICLYLALTKQYVIRHVDLFDRLLLCWRPSWAYLYSNSEDGIDGAATIDPNNHFAERTKDWPLWRRIVIWSAWRNPTGNERFIRPFGFIINPKRVHWIGNSLDPRADALRPIRSTVLWYYASHGFYGGLWLVVGRVHFRIGWKIYPTDALGVSPDDYRSKGCGFALQLQRPN